MKIKSLYILLLLIIIFIPFSIYDSSDDIEAVTLDDTSIGYYQSTTCKISLLEFLIENNNDLELYYNNNDYADINCFGKITGLDKVNDKYLVSIGTNTSINLLLQSCIWLILFMFIPKTVENKKINYQYTLILPFIFTSQFIGENRFYNRSNILHSNLISFENYYLIANFIFYMLLVFVFTDVFKNRVNNIINYIPFIFLIIGTFSGMNLNFYMIVLCFFGVIEVFEKRKISYFDFIYSIFGIVWLFNTSINDYFFDGDKLRGFTNSVYNYSSQIFWIVSVYFLIKGLIFIVEEAKENFDLNLFKQNSIISSVLILFFGFIGSKSPIVNFFNFYIFGQNKRGMKSFESIAGNTWRGFSSSAESIGEFYGFTILLFFLIAIKKGSLKRNIFPILLLGAIYGLYRSNNFAATVSILIILVYVFLSKSKYFENKKKILIIGFILISLIGSTIYIQNKSYEYLSTELVYEATLHQDFYPSNDSYKSYLEVEKKMKERDLRTITNDDTNRNNASTIYLFVVNLLTEGINIPLIPNIIALISALSLLINRTEMWGIFIAKYSPSFTEVLFGAGPLQMNSYLSKHRVRLDVPADKLQSLFLPHSSLLDLLIYTGIIGVTLVLISLINTIYKNYKKNTTISILLIFLSINFLKSDSALYLHSLILFLFCLFSLHKFNSEYEEK